MPSGKYLFGGYSVSDQIEGNYYRKEIYTRGNFVLADADTILDMSDLATHNLS
jgi:hypothetical protein